MDLLDWARGPLLVLALAIFLAGCGWRAWSLLRLPARAPVAGAHRQPGGAGRAPTALTGLRSP